MQCGTVRTKARASWTERRHLSISLSQVINSRSRVRASAMITDVAGYPAAVKSLLALPEPHFVVFSSDPVNGVPWCPDCARSLPAIVGAVDAAKGSLLEVQVGLRPVWRSPDHPFRKDPTLHLTGVPTLIRLDPSGLEVSRIGGALEAAQNEKDAAALVAKFVQG